MKHVELVRAAQNGAQDAFGRLVETHFPRLTAFCTARLGTDGEEAAQETLVRAFVNLRYLENPERFTAWVFAIARNQCVSMARDRERHEELPEDVSGPQASEPQDSSEDLSILAHALETVTDRSREVIELKYLAGLTLKEIALVLGIPESRVKSRLHEARGQVKAKFRVLAKNPPNLGEMRRRTMEARFDRIRTGAHVLCRLSLKDQLALCGAVKEGKKFDSSLLGSIGEVRGGVDFLRACEARLAFRELIEILSYGDPETETRLIEELEHTDPGYGEQIKRNMFFFDDLWLFDPRALEKLHARVKPDLMIKALAGSGPKVREHVIQVFDETAREEWRRRIMNTDLRNREIQSARWAVIEEVHKMEQEGLLLVAREEDHVSIGVADR